MNVVLYKNKLATQSSEYISDWIHLMFASYYNSNMRSSAKVEIKLKCKCKAALLYSSFEFIIQSYIFNMK